MAVFALITSAATNLVLPYFVGRIVDVMGNPDVALNPRYFILAFVAAIIMAASGFARIYFSQNLAFRVIADIRNHIFHHIIGLSRTFFDLNKSGEILSRLAGDTREVGFILTNSVSMTVRQLMIFIGGLALMFYTSPYLAGLVLLIVPLVVIPLGMVSRRLRRFAKIANDSFAEATSIGTEAIQNVVAVQSYGQLDHMREKYKGFNDAHYQSHHKRITTYAILVSYMIICMFGGVIGVFWLGASMVKADDLTQGTLVQFVFYAVMVGGAAQSFSDLWSELMRAAGAGERLVELLKTEETLAPSSGEVRPVEGAPVVEFRDVCFTYPTQDQSPLLEGIDFTLEKNKTLALVGPSGAGKSTVLQLIMRHYDVNKGDIFVSGQSVTDMDVDALRTNFAYVSQEPVIFAMSIRENIAFSRPDASEEEVITAAKSAFAHDFIDKLPEGYDSYVGERGVLLSGGQKARLALARAFLSDAPILLLDEATAALDAESEEFVQEAVEKLRHERTVIVIAHRLATVQRADNIIVIDDGKVVEEGNHSSLMKASKLYAKLAKKQFLAT